MSVARSQGLFPRHPRAPLIDSTAEYDEFSVFSSIFVLLWQAVWQKETYSLFSSIFFRNFSHRAFSKHLFYHTVMAYCYSWLIQVSLTVEKSSQSWENPEGTFTLSSTQCTNTNIMPLAFNVTAVCLFELLSTLFEESVSFKSHHLSLSLLSISSFTQCN